MPSRGPLKERFCKDPFCCGFLPGMYRLELMYVWCWLHSPQRRCRGGEDQHNTRNFPSRVTRSVLLSLFTPLLPLSLSAHVGRLRFPSPSLRNDQLLLFYIFVIIFFIFFAVVQTRHLFLMLKLLVLWLLCNQLSAFESESPEWGVGEKKRGRGSGDQPVE